MTSSTNKPLSEVIQQYAETAKIVNPREMKRFIEEIRERWDPPPDEEEMRFDGWTDEGAFTRCIYQEAFYWHDLPALDRNRPDICQAELQKQVQFEPPLDTIMSFVKETLAASLQERDRKKSLQTLKGALQKQLPASSTLELELPSDVDELYSITNGIRSAGVPTETAGNMLVYPLEHSHRVSRWLSETKMPYEVSLYKKDQNGPIAAFQLGGCEQFRSIYYVLTEHTSSEPRWEIWDRIGKIALDKYDNLAEWIEHETEVIDKEENGTQLVQVVWKDQYP